MKIEVNAVNGFKDFLPPESIKRNEVRKIIERTFELYGFIPTETPIIEFDELIKSESLPNQEDEAITNRFKLQDKGGRNLGLRYELTFQLARIFKQNPNITLPFKRYQIGEVFRDEPILAGKFKQFTQCNIDIIGDGTIKADIECLVIISDILKRLKIDSDIDVNNRKLLKSIIESVQIRDINNVMTELIKIEKFGEDNVKVNLKKYADSNQILTMFKIFEKGLDFLVENEFEGASELKELIDGAKKQGIEIKFNPILIRDHSYYTGNVFEVKESGKSSIVAGGRYDKSVGKYLDKDIPAVGISIGLERITESAKINFEGINRTLIVLVEENIETVKLAKLLRKENISCFVWFDKLEKALEYAKYYNIQNIILVNQDAIEGKKFKLKNVDSGEEKLLTIKQIIRILKSKALCATTA